MLFPMRPVIIQPRPSWSRRDFIEMLEFRFVFFMLILRDIKLRYKQTYLGIAWVILQQLSTAILFSFIFGKWMRLPSENVPYFLFAFCGLIPWLVFSQSVQRASASLLNEAHLVQKIYFPRLFLPLSATLGVGIDFLITIVIYFVLSLFYPVSFHLKIFFLPICTFLIFGLSSAVNVLLSCLSAHYRDFKHIVPFFLQFCMYASPLAYSNSLIPEKWHLLYSLNPMVGCIDLFRWTLLGLPQFPFQSFLISCIATLSLIVLSLILFRKLECTFADVI